METRGGSTAMAQARTHQRTVRCAQVRLHPLILLLPAIHHSPVTSHQSPVTSHFSPMIHVEQLSKRFGAVQALRDVSFSAADGRITGLLGHNGAGKSTTLRILSTVMRADAGRATVDSHDCATESLEVRRRLGVLPHSSGLYAQLTGRE